MTGLRILHVTPYYEGAWAYGGIPRVATTLARGLARRGHRVTVCTTDACSPSSRLPAAGSAPGGGVDVRVFPNASNGLAYHLQLFLPLGLGAYLRAHAGEFDVAHLHGCHHLLGVAAGRALRRAGVPYVLAPHGTAPRLERRRLAKYAFDATLGRRVMPGAARVLAVTEAERRQLLALGAAPSAVAVVPNPLDLAEFDVPPEPGRFRARAGIGTDPLVLFLGKLTPRKRVDVLLAAVAGIRRPDLALVIAGNDLGAGRSLRRLARRLGLGATTRFTGLLTGRERLEALTDADVVAYPSRDEIFGLVPLEALLAGTPVVVAGDSGCGEVIGLTGGGQVVPQGDAAALGRAIARALDAPAAWRAAARAARARITALYDADRVCARLERCYQDVVARAA